MMRQIKNIGRWCGVGLVVGILVSCGTVKDRDALQIPAGAPYRAVNWSEVPHWKQTQLLPSWRAWLEGCRALAKKPHWKPVCRDAHAVEVSEAGVRQFFESRFRVYQILTASAPHDGLMTGYYEPLLKGDIKQTAHARYPLYGVPPTLYAANAPQVASLPTRGERLSRGRIVDGHFVPFYTAADIAAGRGVERAPVVAWVNDAVELLFLQIQGSGRVELPDGRHIRVGFADHNGYGFKSVGRWLIERGELKAHEASMQGIQAWLRRYPHRLNELLQANPRYVFFRRLPDAAPEVGPLGALGVPLTGGYSLAVDPKFTPLGAPVWLETTLPQEKLPLHRLMFAQDTGNAIRGSVRGDFFWGFGAEAGAKAGRMKQRGRMWILLPHGMPLPFAKL